MKKYFIFFIFLSLLFSLEIFAQNGSVFEKKIIASEGKNLVDSNFINQNYFKIYLKNNLLSDSLYYVNFTKGEVIFDETLYNDTLLIEYKLLNPNISFSVRDTSIFIPVIEKEPLFLDRYSKKINNNSEIQTNGTIKKGDKVADAKSIMKILMLAASKGSEILITANGKDEISAIDNLQKLIERNFDENE